MLPIFLSLLLFCEAFRLSSTSAILYSVGFCNADLFQYIPPISAQLQLRVGILHVFALQFA